MGNSCKNRMSEDNSSWNSSIPWDLKTLPQERDCDLTISELNLVVMKWRLLTSDKSLKVFSYNLFEKLFVAFPDKIKLLYVPETGEFISSQQWKEHPLFAQHVRKVVHSFNIVIKYLDDDDRLREYLKNIEEFHRSLRGMKKYYIEVFVKIIDEAMASNFGTLYTGETRKAFRKVLLMVYIRLTWRLLV